MLKSRKVKNFEMILNFDFEIVEKSGAKPLTFLYIQFWKSEQFQKSCFFLISTIIAFFPEKRRILPIFYKIVL